LIIFKKKYNEVHYTGDFIFYISDISGGGIPFTGDSDHLPESSLSLYGTVLHPTHLDREGFKIRITATSLEDHHVCDQHRIFSTGTNC
jgi:hypothetical protein